MTSAVTTRPPLIRAREGRGIAGVCAGLSGHLGLPVAWVRAAVVVLTLISGIGLVFYAWLWIFVPDELAHREHEDSAAPVRGAAEQSRPWYQARPRTGTTGLAGVPAGWQILAGLVLLGLAVALGLQMLLGLRLNWAVLGPAAVILVGLALAWLQLDTLRADRRGRGGRVTSLVLGLLLVLAGMVALAAGFVSTSDLWLSLAVSAIILAGLAFVAAPWLIAYWRDASAQSAALAVQTERAEIAAHLHDSVLQTLALIQRNAEDPAAVTRLTRAQERDLRQYLYADPAAQAGSLADRLRDLAAAVEDENGVPVEVVAVGSVTGEWLEPVLQASREALLNAVRHAGPASVYAEATDAAVEVFVRDRGPGFTLEAVPRDRLGVRESIVGRMERAGGTAEIITGDGGTEVRLRLSVPEEET